MPMTFNTGDLTYEILARSHHHYSHSSSHGSSSGGMEWWMWPLLALGVIAIIWSIVKKFSSN